MAANQEQELKIPVFSVLKNGIILKNIFLNNPNWENLNKSHEQKDEFILIGRHPDCQIVVDHPSISRFHLEIRVNPVLQKLVILDKGSVHGTRICGKKIEPSVEISLNEGDILRLGVSTRLYKLHWVNLGSAFEMENPLPAVLEESEEMSQIISPSEKCNNLSSEATDISSTGISNSNFPNSKAIDISLPKEECNNLSSEARDISSTDISDSNIQNLEAIDISLPNETEYKSPGENDNNATDLQYEDNCQSPSKLESLLSRRSKSKSISSLSVQTGRSKISVADIQENDPTICRALFNSKEEENEEVFNSDEENMTPFSSIFLKSKQKSSLSGCATKKDHFLIQKEENPEAFFEDKENMTPIVNSWSTKSKKALLMDFCNVDGDVAFLSDMENTPSVTESRKLKKALVTDFDNLDGEVAFFSDKENVTPVASGVKKSKKELTDSQKKIESLIKERRKERAPLMPLFGNSPSKYHSPVHSSLKKFDKERVLFQSIQSTPLKNSSPLKNVENIISENEESFLQSTQNSIMNDKGNKSPSFGENVENRITYNEKSFLQSTQNSHMNDKGNKSSSFGENELINSSSESGSQILSNSEASKRKLISLEKFDKGRVPFQLILDSPLKNVENIITDTKRSFLQSTQNSPLNDTRNKSSFGENELINSSSGSVSEIFSNTEESRKKWIMVADIDCFLNEESRKSLQLLEGLGGTQLIIPRIVIRELDCLKRRERYYRNGNKIASSVLKWIEECMVKSSWWIHVQNSLETMPVAPTPPATPNSLFSNRSISNSSCFSTCARLMEIVSPTVEDNIVDCGLLFKKIRDDGHLVLLTNSVTLKIKAMTEGLLCEKPSEFRESLVNPYSKRYLWSGSSPRALSCFDDAELICDGSDRFPVVRNTSTATKSCNSLQGLKLILLNNYKASSA